LAFHPIPCLDDTIGHQEAVVAHPSKALEEKWKDMAANIAGKHFHGLLILHDISAPIRASSLTNAIFVNVPFLYHPIYKDMFAISIIKRNHIDAHSAIVVLVNKRTLIGI
jgi:hypothetical protein